MGIGLLPMREARRAGRIAGLLLPLLCAGCASDQFWLIHPRGPMADASLRAWIVDTAATLLVIGPATLLVAWAVWRYRKVSGKGRYMPSWSHSLPLEILCWGAPLVVVLSLGYYSLNAALAVDPGDPRLMAPGASADASKLPVDIDVVTTDWQWLFIYPDRHIAVANKLVLPVHTPVRFRLTSATVATGFFIPQLGGQIDVMPGMRTRQSLIASKTGTYQGFATDFNGPGFPWMRFQTHVVSADEFAAWAAGVRNAPAHLDQAAFVKFATPTINDHDNVVEFSAADTGLFDRVMQDVMMGNTFPTPPDMTEKKAHKTNDAKQPTGGTSSPNKEQP